jgi:hypothetical protein
MRTRPIIIATAIILVGVAIAAIALNRAKQSVGSIECGNSLVSIGFAARLW